MPRTILCFGDSNTHGTPPMRDLNHIPRFAADVRWPGVMRGQLGPAWEVIEEGLPGRTTAFEDIEMGAHMDGVVGLRIALCSHGPIDVLTIMLGTNDVRTRLGLTPERVTAGLAGLLDIARDPDMQDRHDGFKTLVICPPPVKDGGTFGPALFGARERSLALPPLYGALAAAHGAAFLDAGGVIEVSPIDGVHFDAATHAALGRAVAVAVAAM